MTEFVTTCVAKHLPHTDVNTIITELAVQNISVTRKNWLANETACDLYYNAETDVTPKHVITQAVENKSIDVITQKVANRTKKLLISDMDSTMIQQECIDELAAFAGLKDKVSEITERAMNGELDFAESLRARVALLKELPEAILQEAFDTRIHYSKGARTLLATMRKNGATCILVSGGFTFFSSRVADALGFHHHESNILDIQDGALTGNVIPPIRDKDSKLTALQHYVNTLTIDSSAVLAIGDGANDLPMIEAAGLGVAYYAKPTVQACASAHINHTDLVTLLYAGGYNNHDIEFINDDE